MNDVASNLPAALTKSDGFRDVSEHDRLRLIQRLDYIREIYEKIEMWFQTRDESLEGFLEDIELDLTACVNLRFDAKSTISIWLLHNSFRPETNPRELREVLSAQQIAFLDSMLATDVEATGVEKWLQEFASALRETLDRFFSATAYHETIAHHIAVDALVSIGAGVVAKLHFNTFIRG